MDDTVIQIMVGTAIAAITGGVSAVGTTRALQVHVSYIKDLLKKHDEAIIRAHARLDENTRRIDDIERRIFQVEQKP